MLSARGDALLSLCEDDNFIVDDYGGSSNYEVSDLCVFVLLLLDSSPCFKCIKDFQK
jgi:hypothetical protein